MSEAFRCSCCREFYNGSPAIDINLNGTTGLDGDGRRIVLEHRVHDDPNPVETPHTRFDWTWCSSRVELCVHCADREAVVEMLNTIIPDPREE